MTKFATLRSKAHSYLTDDNCEKKKERKRHKECVIKQKSKFGDYKHCLKTTQPNNKIHQLEN